MKILSTIIMYVTDLLEGIPDWNECTPAESRYGLLCDQKICVCILHDVCTSSMTRLSSSDILVLTTPCANCKLTGFVACPLDPYDKLASV